MKIDLNKVLLGIITILLSVIGFMTRDAYFEMKNDVSLLRSDVTAIKISLAQINAQQSQRR